jgi:hypothetical protein
MPDTPAETPQEEPRLSSRPFLLVLLGFLAACGVAVAFYFALMGYMKDRHAGYWPTMAVTLAYGLVIVGLCAAFAGAARKYAHLVSSPAARRHTRRFVRAATAYVVLLTIAIGAYRRLHPVGATAYLLALAPAVPLVFAIVSIGIYLREETDEFERAVKSESAIWATGGLLAVATVWGFLEMFRLVPHVDSWVAFPIWALFLVPAEIFLRRRYR